MIYPIAGAFWKPIRKLLNPSFNLKILQSFVPIFNEKTNIMIENLDKEAGNPWFDIGAYMHACTLDMVCGEFCVSCYEKKTTQKYLEKNLKNLSFC